ncbi:DegT/DnrJ/EryC1/StrS family aminotransferase [Gammaproteobacteria bacterium]|nr:DegT/DnrJ/EryC1/StrS family aminotransferase [Gammaproteobacteria bacterium]
MTEPDEFIPIAKPRLGEEEEQAAARALRSGWVSQGPEVAAFEAEFAEFVGAEHACAVSSCTAALHLALLAVGINPGDEVVTVSHSFIATANAVRYCGAIPVFVDIQPATFNMDPKQLEEAIGPRTRAILCVHQLGMPCDLQAILAVAKHRHLPVIEDAACAIGSKILIENDWQRIGRSHADIACFSFHPRKVLTTGDGGMLTTSDAEFDRNFRRLRQHCMDVPDTVRHGAREIIFESYPELGFNYRMTDIQAAVGRIQLRSIYDIVQKRRDLAERYRLLLSKLPDLGLPTEPEWARSNWQSYCVRLADAENQKSVMQKMLDLGIATRRGVMCAHREKAYPRGTWNCNKLGDCDCSPQTCHRLKHSELAQDQGIVLPLFPQMSAAQQDRVVDALRRSLAS